VILDRKRGYVFTPKAFESVVVEIYMRHFHVFIFERIDIDAESMVLA
jgi:hypothetical protein